MEHRRYAGEQRNCIELLALERAQAAGDRWQLPSRHLEVVQDFARAGTAQQLDLIVRDLPEAIIPRDAVDDGAEPGKAVGESAVEIEDDEGVRHAILWRARQDSNL